MFPLLNDLVFARRQHDIERGLCLRRPSAGRGGCVISRFVQVRRHSIVQKYGADVIQRTIDASGALDERPDRPSYYIESAVKNRMNNIGPIRRLCRIDLKLRSGQPFLCAVLRREIGLAPPGQVSLENVETYRAHYQYQVIVSMPEPA